MLRERPRERGHALRRLDLELTLRAGTARPEPKAAHEHPAQLRDDALADRGHLHLRQLEAKRLHDVCTFFQRLAVPEERRLVVARQELTSRLYARRRADGRRRRHEMPHQAESGHFPSSRRSVIAIVAPKATWASHIAVGRPGRSCESVGIAPMAGAHPP